MKNELSNVRISSSLITGAVMQVQIRQEDPSDHQAVFDLIAKAFKTAEFADGREQFLVRKLRTSPSFIPELSLVAETEGKIVGHILVTKIKIRDGEKQSDSLALAPVSVLPEFQNKGIGGLLIAHAHRKARELGYKSVVVVGHEKYYPKFGYQRADEFGIRVPFDVPPENCMVIELSDQGLANVQGVVEYAKEFYE